MEAKEKELNDLKIKMTKGEEAVASILDNIRLNIMVDHCPHCGAAFYDFGGCFSITCSCGKQFCGWCLSGESPNNMHPHASQCRYSLSPGSYYGTDEQFEAVRRKRIERGIALVIKPLEEEL